MVALLSQEPSPTCTIRYYEWCNEFLHWEFISILLTYC